MNGFPTAARATDILRAINSHEPFESVTRRILESACELTGSIHGSFVRVIPETQRLSIEATLGPDWTEDLRQTQLPLGQGVTGRAAQGMEPYVCNDTHQDPNYIELFPYVRSELAVPVIINGVVWGIINLDGTRPNEYPDHIVSEIRLFAELIAAAIEFRLKWDLERQLQIRLTQAEKLSAAGQLLAGIAHEINNPLAVILGTSSLMVQELTDPAQVDSARIIEKQAQRAGDLIRHLLAFSRQTEMENQELEDLVAVVKESLEFVRPHLRLKKASLEFAMPADLRLHARLNRTQIQQVLVNLITNSQHAIEQHGEKGRITISVDTDGKNAFLTVQDNGTGMSRETREKLFQPFFTTKKKGSGTGLGLSISREIAARHHGELTCDSTMGRGSRFQLRLPLEDEPEVLIRPLEAAPMPSAAGPTAIRVLVVDDEAPIRGMLQKILAPICGEVAVAESGDQALSIASRSPFDLVICDVHMAGMDGIELHRRFRNGEALNLPHFILLTGDITSSRVQKAARDGMVEVIGKPFSVKQLRERVRSLAAPVELAA